MTEEKQLLRKVWKVPGFFQDPFSKTPRKEAYMEDYKPTQTDIVLCEECLEIFVVHSTLRCCSCGQTKAKYLDSIHSKVIQTSGPCRVGMYENIEVSPSLKTFECGYEHNSYIFNVHIFEKNCRHQISLSLGECHENAALY